jgi:hypothetical protein
MSFKAKNLEYDKTQPAFLRRLRGEITSSTSDPDRDVNPVARPKAASRLKNGDEDDGPTYVMEDTQDMLSKAEYEALVNGKGETDALKSATPSGMPAKGPVVADDSARAKQKVAAVGGPGKKRKAAKIVGNDEEGEGKRVKIDEKPTGPSDFRPKSQKKNKKFTGIKLSFSDEEDE